MMPPTHLEGPFVSPTKRITIGCNSRSESHYEIYNGKHIFYMRYDQLVFLAHKFFEFIDTGYLIYTDFPGPYYMGPQAISGNSDIIILYQDIRESIFLTSKQCREALRELMRRPVVK